MSVFAKCAEQLALELDGLDQCVLSVCIVAAGQGVAAPGFRIAVNQRLGHGVKEQGSDADAALAKVGQLFGYKGQGRGTAHIHCDRHFATAWMLFKLDERQEKLRRQVVDAIVARVFQCMQGHGLA